MKSISSSKRTVRMLKLESRNVIVGGLFNSYSSWSQTPLALSFEETDDVFSVVLFFL